MTRHDLKKLISNALMDDVESDQSQSWLSDMPEVDIDRLYSDVYLEDGIGSIDVWHIAGIALTAVESKIREEISNKIKDLRIPDATGPMEIFVNGAILAASYVALEAS